MIRSPYFARYLILFFSLTVIFTCSVDVSSLTTTFHSDIDPFLPKFYIYEDHWAHLFLSAELNKVWICPNAGVYYHGVINFSIQVEINSSSGVAFEVLEVLQDEWSGEMEFQLPPGGEINLTYNHIDTRGSEGVPRMLDYFASLLDPGGNASINIIFSIVDKGGSFPTNGFSITSVLFLAVATTTCLIWKRKRVKKWQL